MNPSSDFVQDSTGRSYDAGGNVSRGYQRVGQLADGVVSIGREVDTRNFYGADDRLRVLQKLDIRRASDGSVERAGVWEEYRYDALGRRVLVRVRTEGNLCNYDAWACTASTTRFVWAGDQLLWELKEASGTHAAAAGGTVAYFHAGGIDRPLVITKNGESIVPHQNWRGQFARGTYADGAKVGQRSDCTSYPASGCTPIQWPGERTTARHELEPDNNIQNWFGSLVDDMRDASGQMYRRNRYYDPQTGQFTQPDPIGLAGGLNAYGFAEGDPVSYSDPYGLCPICLGIGIGWALIELAGTAYDAYTAGKTTIDFARGRASGSEVGFALGGLAIGAVGPGGGYSRAGREFLEHGDEPAAMIADVGARRMRNAHLAGQNHPITGIPFDPSGFPDFSAVSAGQVDIAFSGNRATDVVNANRAMGLDRTPEGYVWHHHQNGTTMQLVPADVHRRTGHTGGHSLPKDKEEE